ncbi:MAG: hypothetical protein QM528_09575 [Phycisphaerales bacterium]|nr:hypothetical protein [Phycisphaerales bacterium]
MHTPNNPQTVFIKRASNPLIFRFVLWLKLRAAFKMGISVYQLNHQTCVVKLPFRKINKNPFNSMYLASQIAAGDLSSGLLGQLFFTKYPQSAYKSMLITKCTSVFTTKGLEDVYVCCNNGQDIEKQLDEIAQTGERREITTKVYCRNKLGTVTYSEFDITWSYKIVLKP